jgi:diguanylate cyclase (GGDEF)-like protein
LGNCSRALAYSERTFAITTELGMVDLQVLILALQANCYGALHNEGRALALSQKAIGLAKTQQPEVLADSYLSLGRLYQTLNRPTDALPVLREVLALAGAFKEQAMRGNQLLAKCYEMVGDHRIAYKHYQIFHQLFAEIFTEDSERRMRALEIMHQIQEAKREAELERAKTLALESYVKKLEALNQQVRELSVRDELTGLHNRRHLTDQLMNLFDEAKYRSAPLSLILLDIDHFKVINDTFGHLVGDAVLKQVAELLMTEVRGSDIVARFGGEEFAVLLPESSIERAILTAERIRVAVESAVRSPLGSTQTVTVSLGVAVATGYEDVDMLLGQADAALYQAKRSGRNRVCSAMSQPPTT